MTKPVTHHYVVIGDRSGDRGSLLEKLTDCERQALTQWSKSQPQTNGAVNLMRWPGWLDVTLRIEADSKAAWGAALDAIDRARSNS
jgi:hypothetical protein